MVPVDVDSSKPIFSRLAAQVDWVGLGVGGHPALHEFYPGSNEQHRLF